MNYDCFKQKSDFVLMYDKTLADDNDAIYIYKMFQYYSGMH